MNVGLLAGRRSVTHLGRMVEVQPGPLVVETRGWGRQPGTERTEHRTVQAPTDLGHDVYGVPEGSTIELELRFEAVMDGVLVTGTASGRASGECVRCLEPIEDDVTVDFQELYLFEDASEEEYALEDDLLDLEPLLREAVVETLPHDPWCVPDCPGLCPECGARLADDPQHTHGAAIDPRWSALQQVAQPESPEVP